MSRLKPGQPLRCTDSGAVCQVVSLIDEGGQGGVYRVQFNGKPYALKWYNDVVLRMDRELRRRLQVAVDTGAPSARFLWPFELVTLPDGTRLGYLMRLRHPDYRKVHGVLTGALVPSFRTLAMVGWQLTDALFALHGKGLIYQDLNPGNVFFDLDSGDIEICDNDNVDIDGCQSVMGGVMEFQAPEVVLRHAGPSRHTDLHSLAVMLFRLLHIGHPLVGRRELEVANLSDESAMRRLYGSEATFVFHPTDEANRPVPELHGPVLGHWAIYPRYLREIFTRAFTAGLVDPRHGRVQETEWRSAMRRLVDSVMTCPNCAAQSFYDGARLTSGERSFACWACGTSLPSRPLRLGVRRRSSRPSDPPGSVVVLQPGARLYPHHVGASGLAPCTALAEVVGPRLALRNRSTQTWMVERGSSVDRWPPGTDWPIVEDALLRFGDTIGVVRR